MLLAVSWWDHRVPISRSHVEQGEPLDVVALPGRLPDGFFGVRTCLVNVLDLASRFGFLKLIKRSKF